MTFDPSTIEGLINSWVNGDTKDLDSLKTLLNDIENSVSDLSGPIYACYHVNANGSLTMFLLEYNQNTNTLVDLRKVSIGQITWEDTFDPPTITLRWDDRVTDSSNPKVYATPHTYGSTVHLADLSIPKPTGYEWQRVLNAETEAETSWGPAAEGTLVKESMLFRLRPTT